MRSDQAASRSEALENLVAARAAGAPVGVTSVCSAHPLVIEATMRDAAGRSGTVLVEATSNQVDQDGGYTGMRPADFFAFVGAIADGAGVDRGRLVLGGDHLGPNVWRSLPAAEAMDRADALVAAYAAAGFTKLHLDCSMACADDPPVLGDGPVSRRAARLAAVAEAAAPDRSLVSYVVGTEVPVPGGAAEAIAALEPTSADAARATLRAHRDAFDAAGVGEAWPRVRGLVVQPGVEFDEWAVVDYDPSLTGELRAVLDDAPGLVFEAHSTDYQTRVALAALVRDGWAVLKVGPGLTFALREALFALQAIAEELSLLDAAVDVRSALERAMLADPSSWAGHYRGDADAQALARAFSFSDRSRYYWHVPSVSAAVDALLGSFDGVEIPLPLLSQYLPLEYARVRARELVPAPRALVLDHIGAVLRDYGAAAKSSSSASATRSGASSAA